jgi:glycosyltransferase involved in cell wall biosynthesis
MTSKPKISVILLTYKHEAFVGEALRSWMGQDYPQFELVVADDASTDRTREAIASSLALHGRPGVRVIECHQASNIGVLANFNAAMAACSGDIIIAAAGDDISVSSRLRYAAEIFEANPSVYAVVTNYVKIDASGNMLIAPGLPHEAGLHAYDQNDWHIYAGAPVCGATAAYRAELYREFGPMRPGTHGEDNCYWVRALLLGGVYFDPRPLVQWRQHGANLANHSHEELATPQGRDRYLRFLRAHEQMAPQWERDVALAIGRGLVSPERGAKVLELVRSDCATHALDRCSLGAVSWAEWRKAAWPLLRAGRWSQVRRKFTLRLLPSKRERVWRRLAKERR